MSTPYREADEPTVETRREAMHRRIGAIVCRIKNGAREGASIGVKLFATVALFGSYVALCTGAALALQSLQITAMYPYGVWILYAYIAGIIPAGVLGRIFLKDQDITPFLAIFWPIGIPIFLFVRAIQAVPDILDKIWRD